MAVLAACLIYQCWRIRPYTRLVRQEMRFAPDKAPGKDVRLLAANVLMENTGHAKLLDLIGDVDPDVLLLMETDAAWIQAMEPVLARYPTVLREPRDDYYGLVFATRLAVKTAKVVYLTTDDTPAVYAELAALDGAPFRFVGLHPRPPVPGEDTDERDAQILYSARFARNSGTPVVTMGDFNDAAWSDTSQRFKHVGGYLDPRIGRGLYASFNANHFLIRCPIDQIFVTEGVAMVAFGRGPHIGSDHFPMIATIRVDAELAARLNRAPQPLAGQERTDVEKGVAAHRERLGGVLRENGIKRDGDAM
jgi:endonuclease/exonuclease/phosphatase (EEP) superfamily protein YafD